MNDKIILLIEDNPDDVDLTLRAFKKNNILNKIIVARDGVEAVDYLFGTGKHKDREVKDLPVLVLLDLNLPKMDGLEVLKAIRQNETAKFIPVVILTSSKEEQDIIQGYELGANGYVRKPVDFNEFMKAVNSLNLYWLLWNQSVPVKR